MQRQQQEGPVTGGKGACNRERLRWTLDGRTEQAGVSTWVMRKAPQYPSQQPESECYPLEPSNPLSENRSCRHSFLVENFT